MTEPIIRPRRPREETIGYFNLMVVPWLIDYAIRHAAQREGLRLYFVLHPPPALPIELDLPDRSEIDLSDLSEEQPRWRLADSAVRQIRSLKAQSPQMSLTRIARIVGCDPATVRKYLAPS